MFILDMANAVKRFTCRVCNIYSRWWLCDGVFVSESVPCKVSKSSTLYIFSIDSMLIMSFLLIVSVFESESEFASCKLSISYRFPSKDNTLVSTRLAIN